MPSIQFGKVLCELHIFWWNNPWVSEVPYMIDWFATWSQASLWAILCSKLRLNGTRGASYLSGHGVGEKLGTFGVVKGCPESSDLADMDKNSPLWIFPATLLGPQASMHAHNSGFF